MWSRAPTMPSMCSLARGARIRQCARSCSTRWRRGCARNFEGPIMKHVTLPCGETVPALGQGTWNIGDDPATRREEIAALQHGMDLGMTLIDTAEMYGEGNSE